MKGKVYRNYVTIPKEIRDKIGIEINDTYVDIDYDEETDSIIIKVDRGNSKPARKPAACLNKEIKANFQDADKLSKAYFSECGLLVRTKNSYVRNACEKCKGKLAAEYEDRIDVHCSYVSKMVDEKPEIKEEIKEEIVEDVKPKRTNLFDKLKKQRKKDLDTLTENIKVATKVIDKEVAKLDGKPKRCTTGDTTIRPFSDEDGNYLKCCDCGQFVERGFLVGNDFLCKKCTSDDFKNYMKRRGK